MLVQSTKNVVIQVHFVSISKVTTTMSKLISQRVMPEVYAHKKRGSYLLQN